MTRPTRQAAFLFALSVPLALVICSLWPGQWTASLYYPAFVLAFIGADFLMALPKGRLLSAIKIPPRFYVGVAGTINLRLATDGYARPLPIEALLELSEEAEKPRLGYGYIQGDFLDLTLPVLPVRRGRLTVAALWLRWRGPLGLFEIQTRRPLDQNAEILPDLKGIHDEALRFFARDAHSGLKTQRMKGEGTEFDNLTEFAPGMDNRFIDWKHSARHRKLLAKEFRQERNHQIVFGFDTGHLMLEPI
jgi:uncharacterized protein (DUF58 family)